MELSDFLKALATKFHIRNDPFPIFHTSYIGFDDLSIYN